MLQFNNIDEFEKHLAELRREWPTAVIVVTLYRSFAFSKHFKTHSSFIQMRRICLTANDFNKFGNLSEMLRNKVSEYLLTTPYAEFDQKIQ